MKTPFSSIQNNSFRIPRTLPRNWKPSPTWCYFKKSFLHLTSFSLHPSVALCRPSLAPGPGPLPWHSAPPLRLQFPSIGSPRALHLGGIPLLTSMVVKCLDGVLHNSTPPIMYTHNYIYTTILMHYIYDKTYAKIKMKKATWAFGHSPYILTASVFLHFLFSCPGILFPHFSRW